MASRRLSSKISANQRKEKTSWNVNKHWKIRESKRQLQGSFLMSSPPITISPTFSIQKFNFQRRICKLSFLFSPRRQRPPISELSSEKHLKSFAYIPDSLSKRMSFFFFFGRANSNLDSVTCRHLILKFQKFSLDHLYYIFYPGY